MYIFEIIYKYINRKSDKTYSSENKNTYDYEVCDHIFLPIDSTKKTLACNKCGLVIKADKLPKKKKNFLKDNFFEQ